MIQTFETKKPAEWKTKIALIKVAIGMDTVERSAFHLVYYAIINKQNDVLIDGLGNYIRKLRVNRKVYDHDLNNRNLDEMAKLGSITCEEETTLWYKTALDAMQRNDIKSLNELLHLVDIRCAA